MSDVHFHMSQSYYFDIITVRGESDKKIRDKLKKLMTKRPTFEELQKKGILKGIELNC